LYDAYYRDGVFRVVDVTLWDGQDIMEGSEPRVVSIPVGAREISQKLMTIANTEIDTNFRSWDRIVADVMHKLRTSFRTLGEQWTSKLMMSIVEYSDYQKKKYLITTISVIAGIVLAVCALIPLLLRFQTSIVNVLQIVIKVEKNDCLKLIESAEDYLVDMNKDMVNIRKAFYSINFSGFQVEIKEALEKGKTSKETQQDPSLDPLKSQAQATKMKKRFDNIRTVSSRYKTMLIAVMVGLIAVLIGVPATAMYFRINYFNTTNKLFPILEIIRRRQVLLSGTFFFSKNDLSTASISLDSNNGINANEYRNNLLEVLLAST
jgi:hypothetical protein